MLKGNIKIGIIGCGNMGGAIVNGLRSKNIIETKNIYISDKDVKTCSSLVKTCKIKEFLSNKELVKICDVIILAVKPQDSREVLTEIKSAFSKGKICISIMAGIKIGILEREISAGIPIVRIMPNLAAIVGASISCISYNDLADKKTKDIVESIFKGIGTTLEIDEDKLDAVTSISGSGPAYFFYLVEALKEAGVEMGLSEKEAHNLAINALVGSAKLLESIPENPDILRKRVTSKGGTTEAAFKTLEAKNVKETMKEAIKEAGRKATELSKGE